MSAATRSNARAAASSDSNVAVVTVNYRTPELTERCVASVAKERKHLPTLRMMVVDGGSADDSPEHLAKVLAGRRYAPWIQFLPLPINGGFGWANNQAILRLMRDSPQPRYIHLLNPDAEIEPGAIKHLVNYLDGHPRVAAVGSQLVNQDGSLAGSAFNFPSIRGELARGAGTRALERILKIPPISVQPSEAAEVDWVTGGSVLLRVDALREVGLFDEGFFLYNEEVELMWRLRNAGWAIATEPRSRVTHAGGSSTGIAPGPTGAHLEPRLPAYLFRSRSRFFALTRGRAGAVAAYAAWLAGYAIWRFRRLVGVPIGNPVDHQFRDHVAKAFPRGSDLSASVPSIDSEPTKAPAWMAQGGR